MNKTSAQEFTFFLEKLEQMGNLLVIGGEQNLREVAFMIGCLHTICIYSVERFNDGN